MSLATRCPECGTAFRLSREQLEMADGWARCGQCDAVFRASDHLFDPNPPWVARGADLTASGAGVGAGGPAEPTPVPAPAAAAPAAMGFSDEPLAPAAPGLRALPDIDLELPGSPPVAAGAPASRPRPDAPAAPDVPSPLEDLALQDLAPPGTLDRDPLPTSSPDTVPAARPTPDFELDIPPVVPTGDPTIAPSAPEDMWQSLDRTRDIAHGEATEPAPGPAPSDLGSPPEAMEPEPAPPPTAAPDAPPDESRKEAPEAEAAPAVDALYARAEEYAPRENLPKPRGAAAAVGWSLLSVGLVLTLLLQWVRVDRDTLAALWPEARPAIEALCQATGCQVRAVRNLRALVVDSSTLERLSDAPLHRWKVVLRNRSDREVRVPAFELTLQGDTGQALARRVLTLEELGQATDALAPKQELVLEVTLDLGGRDVTSHGVEIFYP